MDQCEHKNTPSPNPLTRRLIRVTGIMSKKRKLCDEDSNEIQYKSSNRSIDTQILLRRGSTSKALLAAAGHYYNFYRSPLALALQNFEADHKFTIKEVVDISNESRVPALLDALKARSFGYELTSTDLCDIHSETNPPPVIRAAENPNPNILRGLLRFDKVFYPDISKEWGGMFALLKAVRHQPASNVILLLLKGADPNGCSYHDSLGSGRTSA